MTRVARRCLEAGIAVVREGARLGDIGAAILDVAREGGCSVVSDYGGHGIGRKMHAPPHVSHVGERGKGPRLRAGMCFTIEPMVNLGGPETRLLEDGWTVVTADGSLSAQFEHTIFVMKEGCEVLTLPERQSGAPPSRAMPHRADEGARPSLFARRTSLCTASAASPEEACKRLRSRDAASRESPRLARLFPRGVPRSVLRGMPHPSRRASAFGIRAGAPARELPR